MRIPERHVRNCKPSTFQEALFGIYIFLDGVKSSGKTRVVEITKEDLEYFVDQEQDRRLIMLLYRQVEPTFTRYVETVYQISFGTHKQSS